MVWSGQSHHITSSLQKFCPKDNALRTVTSTVAPSAFSSHFPPPKSKFVLVTGSEVIAAAGLPSILTLPDSAAVVTPKVPSYHCWDTVWVVGGFAADPFSVLKGIYGTYQGSLKVLLDLGTLPVVRGESATSVITRLNELADRLKNSLRLWSKGPTQVFVLPPVVYLGDGDIALHQSPARAYSKLAMAQLIELKRYIDSRNSDLMGRMTNTPLRRWGDLASSPRSEMIEDSMGRMVEQVAVESTPSVLVEQGILHLRPDSLTALIRSLVAFVGAHAWATW